MPLREDDLLQGKGRLEEIIEYAAEIWAHDHGAQLDQVFTYEVDIENALMIRQGCWPCSYSHKSHLLKSLHQIGLKPNVGVVELTQDNRAQPEKAPEEPQLFEKDIDYGFAYQCRTVVNNSETEEKKSISFQSIEVESTYTHFRKTSGYDYDVTGVRLLAPQLMPGALTKGPTLELIGGSKDEPIRSAPTTSVEPAISMVSRDYAFPPMSTNNIVYSVKWERNKSNPVVAWVEIEGSAIIVCKDVIRRWGKRGDNRHNKCAVDLFVLIELLIKKHPEINNVWIKIEGGKTYLAARGLYQYGIGKVLPSNKVSSLPTVGVAREVERLRAKKKLSINQEKTFSPATLQDNSLNFGKKFISQLFVDGQKHYEGSKLPEFDPGILPEFNLLHVSEPLHQYDFRIVWQPSSEQLRDVREGTSFLDAFHKMALVWDFSYNRWYFCIKSPSWNHCEELEKAENHQPEAKLTFGEALERLVRKFLGGPKPSKIPEETAQPGVWNKTTKKYERDESTAFDEESDFQLRVGLTHWINVKKNQHLSHRFASANNSSGSKKVENLLPYSFSIIWDPSELEIGLLKGGQAVYRNDIKQTISLVKLPESEQFQWYACIRNGCDEVCCMVDDFAYLYECLTRLKMGQQPGYWDLERKTYIRGEKTHILDEESDKVLRQQAAYYLLPQDQSSVVVLEGEAGIGKSTTFLEIARGISGNNPEWRSHYDEVISISLRHLNDQEKYPMGKKYTACDFLIEELYGNTASMSVWMVKALSEQIRRYDNNGRLLLLLDDVDAYKPNGPCQAAFEELLSFHNVIVSTRSHRRYAFQKTRIVSLRGFSDEDTSTYLRTTVPDQTDSIQTFLGKNPDCRAMIRTPANFEILCAAWDGMRLDPNKHYSLLEVFESMIASLTMLEYGRSRLDETLNKSYAVSTNIIAGKALPNAYDPLFSLMDYFGFIAFLGESNVIDSDISKTQGLIPVSIVIDGLQLGREYSKKLYGLRLVKNCPDNWKFDQFVSRQVRNYFAARFLVNCLSKEYNQSLSDGLKLPSYKWIPIKFFAAGRWLTFDKCSEYIAFLASREGPEDAMQVLIFVNEIIEKSSNPIPLNSIISLIKNSRVSAVVDLQAVSVTSVGLFTSGTAAAKMDVIHFGQNVVSHSSSA